MKRIHFVSGLPRSGSTLLSAILNQNPQFLAPPASVLCESLFKMHTEFRELEQYRQYPTQSRFDVALRSFGNAFYSLDSEPVIFDKSRSWARLVGLASAAFDNPQPKVIACVMSADEIVASFLRLIRKNLKTNFIDMELKKRRMDVNDLNRCRLLLIKDDSSPMSNPLVSLAIGLEHTPQNIHLVEYQDLVKDPRETMRRIYDFVGEEWYEHDFTSIQGTKDKAGRDLGLKEIHDVRSTMSPSTTDVSRIPKEFLKELEGMNFWRK